MLFPISLLYWLVIWIRNRLFDKQVLKSSKFNFPIICVGNLAVGGTGKTPMVELLLRLLHQQFQTATISRGYKRKTKGFGIAGENTTALEIGDEPMQFHRKFPDVTVAVGEERLEAIPQLLQEKPGTEVIILDDAFQHRTVTAGLNILLTEYSNLYTRDFALPAGDLRDIRSSASRAEIIVVTKCPATMEDATKRQLLMELGAGVKQKVYFTSFDYSLPTHLFQPNLQCKLQEGLSVLLVCGIANPKPLKEFLNQQVKTY
ncbi:MAG: tetraacyldisaccharide 4-kinase, partial [Bacteroidota bacterium]